MDAVMSPERALGEMRVSRRRRRVADLEWFEALYRVYLAAFVVGGTILFLSGLVGDSTLTPPQLANLGDHGPSIIGVLMAVSVLMGARSGSTGGPLSVENAEVVHVLLAPVGRGAALRRPFLQRVRALAFSGALAGATAGQLLHRRLPAPRAALIEWAFWGGLSGAVIGVSFVAAAGLSHEFPLPRWVTSLVTMSLLGWQVLAAVPSNSLTGPFDAIGRVSLWPLRHEPLALCAVLLVVAGVACATALVERFSLESLARRSALVTQLRFAVTLQDLRTVVLLRRQLNGESARVSPWFSVPRLVRRHAVVGRSVAGIARFPSRKIARMSVLTVLSAVGAVLAWRGTTPLIAVSGVLAFIVGLDLVEPLSQEVDQPDRTDSLPLERGHLHLRLLLGSVMVVVPLALVATATAVVLEPGGASLALALLIAPTALFTALAGATINVLGGAPDPAANATGGLALPPEVSGMGTVLRTAWPPAVATVGLLPVIAARVAEREGLHVVGTAIRSCLMAGFLVALVAGWVRQRDAIRSWFRNAQAAGGARQSPTRAPGGEGNGVA